MKIKMLLLREDGESTIWCKAYDEQGNLSETEYTISYDEWDAVQKERVEKNVWILDVPETEQDERIKWILQPERMIYVLRAMAQGAERPDINFMLSLGTISEEYQKQFNQPPMQFIIDARKAKEVFEFLLNK